MSNLAMLISAICFILSVLAYLFGIQYGASMLWGASIFWMVFSIRIKMDEK